MAEQPGGPARPVDDHALSVLEYAHVAVDGADWAVELELTPRLTNSSGRMMGGLVATIMDLVASFPLLFDDESYHQVTTTDLHVTFHSGAKVGPILVTAHVNRRGRSFASVRCEVYDKGDDMAHVATGLLSFAGRMLGPDEQHKVLPKAERRRMVLGEA
jgi:uncharacterized protein (TIGR00369 family)